MPDWPHAPLHRFEANGTYFVTGATYLKRHYYRSRENLNRLQDRIFGLAREHRFMLEGWSIFSNHYHLVGKGVGDALRLMLSQLHSLEAIQCNRDDGVGGRKVWYQFWETELTFERSWMARLRYTHENAVHHGLVRNAANYPWCSASWFVRTASPAFVNSVRRFKIDRIHVRDGFEVEPVE
jgi:putative transposase